MCLALWQHPCPLRLLRRHLSQSERLWHSVTFSRKRKSVSSKTKPLCQGLPCQGSWRASARLRGWTKDAFRLSGITQVLLCTTSPTSSLRSMPPPLVGEALAFRDVFQQTQISFIENETSLPRAPLLGELSSGCETERARPFTLLRLSLINTYTGPGSRCSPALPAPAGRRAALQPRRQSPEIRWHSGPP